jgi:putative chitinase
MTLDKLAGVIPSNVIAQIPSVEDKFQINTPLRLAHFLSQCAHESSGFMAVRENLNYSAAALRVVFSKYFPTEELAQEYQRQPEKIANIVYANRMGNGNSESGDGWNYRGRGYIQLTGKANYSAFSNSIGQDCVSNPDLIATEYPLASAAWFFNSAGLQKIADQGATDEVVTEITKKINGGINGLTDRQILFNKYIALLN